MRVVDDEKRPVPADTVGNLQARGITHFVGYLKKPQLNSIDADGWFDTGDLARMDRDGYIRIVGRTKDVIIRGGENIPVAEVENLIYRHPAVAECAVVAMPDARLGERACAFVVAKAGARLDLAELTRFLGQAGHGQDLLARAARAGGRHAAHAVGQDPEIQAARGGGEAQGLAMPDYRRASSAVSIRDIRRSASGSAKTCFT